MIPIQWFTLTITLVVKKNTQKMSNHLQIFNSNSYPSVVRIFRQNTKIIINDK
jgi:hypothetical protein